MNQNLFLDKLFAAVLAADVTKVTLDPLPKLEEDQRIVGKITDVFTQQLWARHCELAIEVKAVKQELRRRLSQVAADSMHKMISGFGSGENPSMEESLAPLESCRKELEAEERKFQVLLDEANFVADLFWRSVRAEMPEDDKHGESLGIYEDWQLLLTVSKKPEASATATKGACDCPGCQMARELESSLGGIPGVRFVRVPLG